MALLTGAIRLPYTKFDKFNCPRFQGRRWDWVDPAKDAQGDVIRINNRLISRSRICEESGDDWEEILFEIAEEEMLMDELGLSAMLQVQPKPSADDQPQKPAPDDE